MTTPFAPLDSTASTSANPRRVAYYYDPDVGNYVYYLGHPMKPHRIRMAHNLIVNYGLCDEEGETDGPGEGIRAINGGEMDHDHGMNGHAAAANPHGPRDDGAEQRFNKALLTGGRGKAMQVFRAPRAGREDMTRFHTDEYIDFLERVTPETSEAMTGGGVRCLTGEDCPAFEGLFEFCSISAGGSIAAAQRLNSGAADICVNWAGGLHHAKKTEASGFCYVNDIVLATLELLRIHPRVLYIDVDVHHGDGVEEAFYTTDRVMTASFHRFGEFFPGTGDVRDLGLGRGKGYAVNVPLRDGITDEAFHSIFKPVIRHIIDFYRPGAIVLQMGADSLSGDKLGGFNMTLDGHAECASFVRSFNLPVLMLGGGGYTTKNVARAWCNETAVMCGRQLSEDLPFNQYMEYYGPRYKLEVLANNTDNHNPPEYLDAIKQRVLENLRNLPHAPGAQMQQVPKHGLLGELGMEDGSDPEDEVDNRLRRLLRKRQLNGNGGNSSGSDSEADDVPSPRRPVGAATKRQPKGRRSRPLGDSDDDDPCGVTSTRKKRTFFRAKGTSGDPLGRKLSLIKGLVGVNKAPLPNGLGQEADTGGKKFGATTNAGGALIASGGGLDVLGGNGLANGAGVVEWSASRQGSPMSVM